MEPEAFYSARSPPVSAPFNKQSIATLVTIERQLLSAYRLSNSGRTKKAISDALQLVILLQERSSKRFQIETDSMVKEGTIQPPEVCPEYYGNMKEDDLLFDHVYKSVDCVRQPVNRLVQVLALVDTCEEFLHLAKRIRMVHPDIPLVFAVTGGSNSGCLKSKTLSNVELLYNLADEALTWRTLASTGDTKYILVGRNMLEFTNHTDLDRMLRVINNLPVAVVGGAVRLEPEGQWFQACYQIAMRNFTMRVHPGHDLSSQSCAYCDYLASPFLVRRDIFLQLFPNISLPGVTAFIDFFCKMREYPRASLHAVACVDVLFNVAGRKHIRGRGVAETPRHVWSTFARKWKVERILLPGKVGHTWSCEELKITCSDFRQPGVVLPPCCIQELAKAIKVFATLTSKYHIPICLVSGNVVGAVKIFGGILPWERDTDIGWKARKFKVLQEKLIPEMTSRYKFKFSKPEYYTKYGSDIDKCQTVTDHTCIYFNLYTKSFRVQIFGEPIMTSEFLQGLVNPTLVYIDGMWVATVPNPGRLARHQYADNVLGHVQHYRDYGTDNLNITHTEQQPFLTCKSEVAHACLANNYFPLGNIQFQDVLV